MLPFCERVVSVRREHIRPDWTRSIPVSKQPQTIGEHLRKQRFVRGLRQSEAAKTLGVSTVTLSRWECDKVYPTWLQQPAVTKWLGYNPFTDPALGSPKGNESKSVAFLAPNAKANIGWAIIEHCLKVRKALKQFAKELGLSPKTVWNWKTGRRKPCAVLKKRIEAALGVEALEASDK